jgi:hypothetical protein
MTRTSVQLELQRHDISHESNTVAIFFSDSTKHGSRDSAVGIATGYGLDDRGIEVEVPVGSRIFSSTRRPDRFWGPSNLLSGRYGGSFPGGKAAGA